MRYNLEDKKLTNEYYLIQISANNSKNNIPIESKTLLDNYDYEDAIKYDKRSFMRIYYICILSKENILNIFLINSPLELRSIRWIIFILIYTCDFALNTVFTSMIIFQINIIMKGIIYIYLLHLIIFSLVLYPLF